MGVGLFVRYCLTYSFVSANLPAFIKQLISLSSDHSSAEANDASESATSEDPVQDIKVEETKKDEEEKNCEDAETAKFSYPKPKNFAERMMNALERGIASEAISWAGGGKAIALKTKHLKNSPELSSYFKAKDYSGFIRNCNRW